MEINDDIEIYHTGIRDDIWTKDENETLIQYHKMAKMYKKRYQRASDFHNSLYRFFGLITVLTSTISSTISWGSDNDEKKGYMFSLITTTSAISAAIQNFYKFQENSNEYTITSKAYSLLQNKIEGVGNILPGKRPMNPIEFNEEVHNELNDISEKRKELSDLMIRYCYQHKDDNCSYLQDKYNVNEINYF